MITTKVYHLGTSRVLEYGLPPDVAVIAAYEQGRGNGETWNYLPPELPPELKYGPSGKTVICGNYAAALEETQ